VIEQIGSLALHLDVGPFVAAPRPTGTPSTPGRGMYEGGLVVEARGRARRLTRRTWTRYRSFLHVVASTIGSALDNASRRSDVLGQYQHVSETLQRAMLPPANCLPFLAVRCLPVVDSLAVGGDWYDVVELDHDRRALVVGDCVGHGLGAATVMAQLRSAARAMLLDGRDPAEVLEGLDAFAAATSGAMCATVVCAVIDHNDDTVTYARAGHPPPLVLRSSGTVWLDQVQGLPLAVDVGVRRQNASTRFGRGDLLVMYTDGLTERRGESCDVGLERLRSSAQLRHGAEVGAVADGLLSDLLPDGASDDVILLVKSIPDRASDHLTAGFR
jgi:serine phosphatase RsbU (regulator of sigma subunit)